MLMWGGCDSSRYDFLGEASLSKTLASLKKIAGFILNPIWEQKSHPETTIVEFPSPPGNKALHSLPLARVSKCLFVLKNFH